MIMYEKAKNYTLLRPRLKKTLGIFFIILGVLAVIAPIIPGAPIVFIGLELLGLKLVFLDRIKSRFRRQEV